MLELFGRIPPSSDISTWLLTRPDLAHNLCVRGSPRFALPEIQE